VTASLKLGPNITLPIDVAGEAIAILAKRGAGKTNTGRVLVEELVEHHVQTVVLDPVGAWWGLRYGADRKSDGLAMPVLGGAHGDVPLEPTAGRLIADVVVDSGQSLVLDLSDFPSKAAMSTFVFAFAEHLYTRKGRSPSLLHLVLEEADLFAPQSPKGGWKGDTGKAVAAIETIVRRGRSRGFGLTMITQRSAVLNKDVLTQTDVLIVMQTTGPQDIKAIRAWVSSRADGGEDGVLPSLPSLAKGEAWVWDPGRDLLKRVHVRRSHTFDSGTTPKAGERRVEPTKAAPIDLTALGEQIAATVERARENDPGELRKKVRELEKQLAARPAETRVETETVVETVEVPALTASDRELLSRIERMVEVIPDAAAQKFVNAADAIKSIVAELVAKLPDSQTRPAAPPRLGTTPQRKPAREPSETRTARPTPAPARRPAPEAAPDTGATGGASTISSSQQRILDALAWFEAFGITQPSRPALAFIAGTRPTSGGFKNNLGALKNEKGIWEWPPLLDYPTAGRVCLTDEGRARAAEPSIPLTNGSFQQAALDAVTNAQAAILRALIDVYPEELSREDLADTVGVPATSGGFKNNLGALRTLELIDYPSPGVVTALPVLFPEERA